MPELQFVKFKIEDQIAVVTLDNPPVNILTSKVMKEINETFVALEGEQSVKVIVFTTAGTHAFIAGADIKEIAQRHFSRLKGPPKSNNLGFKRSGNKFDDLIRGWARYWNDVLTSKDPLDPDLVKALIASESGFNPDEWNHKKGKAAAYGLMQVLDSTV